MKTLLCVSGPTASGKTSLAIDLAKTYQTEIISVDSRQFYKEMMIGTAVPSDSELKEVKHHLIQHKSVCEVYTLGDFVQEARTILDALFAKHEFVVAVGGSTLFMDALINGIDEFPEIETSIRNDLNTQLQKEGLKSLQDELKQKDPEYYDKVDINNPHRLIRALEVCRSSGSPYSSFLNKSSNKLPYRILHFGIEIERALLYNRINKRVDLMVHEGLFTEVQNLVQHKELNALNTVGYKEAFSFFDNQISREHAIEEIKKNSRRYAKRQLTWYRKNEDIHWVGFELSRSHQLQKIKSRIENKREIVIITGVSGVGKTFLGQKLSDITAIPFSDADDFHPEANKQKMKSGVPLNDQDRLPWLQELNSHIKKSETAHGLILACSALKHEYRRILEKDVNNKINWVCLEANAEVIQKRLQERRDHFMPESLLQSQLDTYERDENAIQLNTEKPVEALCNAILFELYGA
jgi:tRNA dimethylallyltransferase